MQVTFFMRKGADLLSKWVGEAERQLRLLFEEASRCQPAIIFFDEIDGLAPVSVSWQWLRSGPESFPLTIG
jgi:SpoVK/Ycf46/Vps4 family AAA+-type ATPase